MKNKTIIEMLEVENKSLREELDSRFENEQTQEQRRQIRAAALQMALSFRLTDTSTTAEVLANAASYEQFIGGFDKLDGSAQAIVQRDPAKIDATYTNRLGADEVVMAPVGSGAEPYPPADED